MSLINKTRIFMCKIIAIYIFLFVLKKRNFNRSNGWIERKNNFKFLIISDIKLSKEININDDYEYKSYDTLKKVLPYLKLISKIHPESEFIKIDSKKYVMI